MSKKKNKKHPENENVTNSLKNIQTIVMNRVQNFPVSRWHWFISKVIVLTESAAILHKISGETCSFSLLDGQYSHLSLEMVK